MLSIMISLLCSIPSSYLGDTAYTSYNIQSMLGGSSMLKGSSMLGGGSSML